MNKFELHPSTLALLNGFVKQYVAHIQELSGEPAQPDYPLDPVQDVGIQAMMIACMAHAMQACDQEAQVGSNYTPEDAMLGGLQDFSQVCAAADALRGACYDMRING